MGCLPQISSHEYGSKSLMPKPADWTTKHDQIILNLQSPKLVPSWHAPAAKTKKQCTNCKHQAKKNAADKGYEVSDIPFSLGYHCIFLVSHLPQTRRLTSIQKSFQDLETPQSWFRKWEFVAFLASLWEIRRVLFRFLFRKKGGENNFSQLSDFHLFRNLRGKTQLSLEAIRGERLGASQPTIMLAFVGPPLGGPTWSVTQLHTVSVGHASGSKDFRRRFFWDLGRKWWSDFGRLDLKILSDFGNWMDAMMQLEKKRPRWSWRFLGFSGEVEVWCSQIHSQNPKRLNDHGV